MFVRVQSTKEKLKEKLVLNLKDFFYSNEKELKF